MTHRIRIAAALVALTGAVTVAAPAQAVHRGDGPHCVSNAELREYYRDDDADDYRDVIEERFEVVDRGRPVNYYDGQTYILRYPACGYSISEGYVRVQYRWRDDMSVAADRHIKTGAGSITSR